ncbi:cation acetate symporter [bacterium]|nr:MAG: cation acetate symporter [bacterium]
MSIPLLFVILVIVATVVLGIVATGRSKSASDFFVAGRGVGVLMNASAISGEYLSAASFMGIAGLVMKNGYDALWYPVGYAAGYLFLLLFIAGPLRRFGAYTIPDFAEGRFDSPAFRKVAVIFVLFIGFFYTMPQMKGAGTTMGAILGWPYWVGIVVVGSVISFNVALGGMKGITLVQAFQYWAKVFAIAVPFFVLAAMKGGATPKSATDELGLGSPRLKSDAPISVKGASSYPANVMTLSALEGTFVFFPEGATIEKIEPSTGKFDVNGFLKKSYESASRLGGIHGANSEEISPAPVWAQISFNGSPVEVAPNSIVAALPEATGNSTPGSLKLTFAAPTKVRLFSPMQWDSHDDSKPGEGINAYGQAEALAPNAPVDAKWENPFGPFTTKHGYPMLYTYSLIIALVCGTAGLPHILVRFYTNPDGRSAKRTTLWVMVMLGVFYVFTPLWGTLGRSLMPELYANNATDQVVIKLPTILQNETLGQILSGITSAGAFAAFMSTFSGLLVSMAGAFSRDIYGKILRPNAPPQAQLNAFKIAAVGVGVISMLLGLLVETFDIATMVGWAFAIGAASYFPLLLLGAWWRGLTHVGAAAGMLLGGLLSLGAIVGSMLLDKKVLVLDLPPLVRALMEQPAIWGVPLSLGTMWLVSRATAAKIPADVDQKMLRLHAPEELGISRNYVEG